QRVIRPRVRVEHVDQEVAVVLDDPLTRLVTFDPHPAVANAAHRIVDLFRQRVDLAAARAGADDEVVVQGMQAAHVEDDNVAGLVITGRPGTDGGPFGRTGGSESRRGKRRGNQWTSSGPSGGGEVMRSRVSKRRGVGVAVEHLPSGFRRAVRPAPAHATGAPPSYSPRRAERSRISWARYLILTARSSNAHLHEWVMQGHATGRA